MEGWIEYPLKFSLALEGNEKRGLRLLLGEAASYKKCVPWSGRKRAKKIP